MLAAQRYLDHHTDVGVIIGTGTNACYVEDAAKLTKWRPPAGTGAGGRTAVNMEWGAFFSPKLPRCMEDLQVRPGGAGPEMVWGFSHVWGADLFMNLHPPRPRKNCKQPDELT